LNGSYHTGTRRGVNAPLEPLTNFTRQPVLVAQLVGIANRCNSCRCFVSWGIAALHRAVSNIDRAVTSSDCRNERNLAALRKATSRKISHMVLD
jgi:hypothetical protein